ncbi:facilitated trehalose transporter Tret1 [Bicyclus anynana]|uniref:Facilitated trehalose transporter Tret1 n=1 Tax=Bicyclus anynana TaxID=110368 RepID=A0ABM3M1P7_BICAN|nr:facilitated trehalose transporter Tret1 [Bicyclus anynana]
MEAGLLEECFVTAAVGLNIISFGCTIGFPAILLPQLTGSKILLSKEQESWYAAILPLSVLIGNFVTPPIMDGFGRKVTHYALTIISLVGWCITIIANSFEALIIGRFWQGIAAGLLTTLRSVLIGECTRPEHRGAFLTTVSISQAFGVFFVHLVGSFLSWQRTAIICVFVPFVSLVMVAYTPKSPSWLLKKGRYDECKEVFRWLRGSDAEDELSQMIQARLAYKRAEIKNPSFTRHWFINLISIIRKREFYKPVILMVISNILMHISGASTFSPYAILILGLLMGSDANIYFWMVFLDTNRFVTNILAIYIINRVKRRTMVLATGVLSVASHVAIACYVYFKQNGWDYEGIWLPALLINLQFLAVGTGMVPMPQVIGGEIFPLEYRSIGGTISMAAGVGIMFVALKTFPNLTQNVGLEGTYGLYAVILLVNLIALMLWLPETKGKTLQQIEDELRGDTFRDGEILEEKSLLCEEESLLCEEDLLLCEEHNESRCSSPTDIQNFQ